VGTGKTQADRERLARRSLRYSVYDGAASAAMIGFGESFFTAFAVFLRANNIQIGLLSALPQALGSALQLASGRLLALAGSRRALVSSAALLQALMYLPMALAYFAGPMAANYLIAFACLYWVFGMILGPAWNSWMGDLTSENERGAYFGRRSKVVGAFTFGSFLLGGAILGLQGDGPEREFAGFASIFALALIVRVISFLFLRKMHEPPMETPAEREAGFVEFLRGARSNNYGLLALYLSLMNFSVYVAVPFFTPYMLRDLGFDYLTFTLVSAAAVATKVLTLPVWGGAVDRFGSRKVLTLAGVLMPVVPALWLFSGGLAWLVAIQLYSGFAWAGFEIASMGLIFDATEPSRRASSVAYYNVLNGAAILVGALLGGVLVRYSDLFASRYMVAFLASFVLRGATSYFFLPRIREVRRVEAIGYPHLFFKIVSSMPTMGPVLGIIPFRPFRRDRRR